MKQSLWCSAACAAALAQAAAAAGQTSPEQTPPLPAAAAASPAPQGSQANPLRALVEAAQQDKQRKNGSDHQKIADFYASYMDVERIDKLGYRPLIAELQRIRMLRDRRGLPQVIAHFIQLGVPMPYRFATMPDLEHGRHYVASLVPAPAGAKGSTQDYTRHVEKVMALAGRRNAAEGARAAVDMERLLVQLKAVVPPASVPSASAPSVPAVPAPVQMVAIDKLGELAPGYDWQYALGAVGIAAKTDSIAVADPGFLKGFARLAAEAELDSWKAYLEWQLLRSFSPFLSQEFASADAAYFGGRSKDRSEEGVRLVSAALPDLVGKQYVAQTLPPERRARLEGMVAKQLAACREPFSKLGDNELAGRLATLRPLLGGPARWRDTNSLLVTPHDLVANVIRINQLAFYRMLSILGKALDEDDWPVAAQSTELVYDARRNVLVLPAGALRDLPDQESGQANLLGSMIGKAIASTMDTTVVAAQLKQACSTPIPR